MPDSRWVPGKEELLEAAIWNSCGCLVENPLVAQGVAIRR
jgi:hypothetical protein